MIFEVLDKNNNVITAYDFLLQHSEWYGTPEHKNFIFGLQQNGELIIISDQPPFRFSITLEQYKDEYKIIFKI